jgi:hypothetical protein
VIVVVNDHWGNFFTGGGQKWVIVGFSAVGLLIVRGGEGSVITWGASGTGMFGRGGVGGGSVLQAGGSSAITAIASTLAGGAAGREEAGGFRPVGRREPGVV